MKKNNDKTNEAFQVESLLHRIPLFTGLPDHVLKELAETLNIIRLERNEFLFKEDEPGDCFYVILDGEAEVVKSLGNNRQRMLAVRGPGDYLGEMSLLDRDGLRTASVVTRTPVKFLRFTQEDFYTLLKRWPELALQMLRELSARLRDADNATIRELREINRELAKAYDELKAAQEQIIEKERLERELQVARKIQMSILPKDLPQLPGFDFGAIMEPARAVGGDLYDFIPLDQHRYGIVIGDVSDKGVPAAIFMALTRSLLRAKANQNTPPESVLQQVNRLLLDMNNEGMFVTVFYAILDSSERTIQYARAGHESPILFQPDGKFTIPELKPGQPLGILDHPLIDTGLLTIPERGTLLLYTDGVLDAADPEGEFFTEDRLVDRARLSVGKDGQDMCVDILTAIRTHQSTAAQTDDITMVTVHSNPE